MSDKFPHLFSPLTIRGKAYRNRILFGPTLFAHSVYIDEIRENVYRMCENRAKGGAAEVSTGEICINFEEGICEFVNRPLKMVPAGKIDYTKYEGPDFDLFREYAERITKHGAIALLEFCHGGSFTAAEPPYSPYGPDAFIREDGTEVKAMTPEIMDKICRDFATAALFAKACGFDGILIHGGHGFLFQQWVSPRTNHRTDEFGGSMENRAKFPCRILDTIREAVGEDFIIEVRFSAEEDGFEDGLTIEDTCEFCKLIDGKCDIIHVSNGLKSMGNSTHTFTDSYDPHGYNVPFAEKIKKVVKISKVGVIGGLNSPEFCDRIIAEGKTDFVIFGRQGYADPEFANKAKAGKERLIRRCVRCFQCYPGSMETEDDPGFPFFPSPAMMGRCAINPEADFALYPERLPVPEASRKVLVIGGGVGGMQAAITATKRGHQVLLCEKVDRLGGTINFTEFDEDKQDLWNFRNTLIAELDDRKIPVRLNTEVDEAFIRKYRPDAVILAIGADPFMPDLPGAETAVSSLDVYYHPEQLGEKIVIIGGNLTGCEVGLHLARHGKEVTVLSRNALIAKEAFCSPRTALKDELAARNVVTIVGAACTRIVKDGVYYSKDGQEKMIPADTAVLALGMKSRDTAALQAACGDIPVFVIGDCEHAGKVGKAVKDAYNAAMAIL